MSETEDHAQKPSEQEAQVEGLFQDMTRAVSWLMVRTSPIEDVQRVIRGFGVKEEYVEALQYIIAQGCEAALGMVLDGKDRAWALEYLRGEGIGAEDVESLLDECLESARGYHAEAEELASGSGDSKGAVPNPEGWDDPVPPGLHLDFSSPDAVLNSIEAAYRARSYQGVVACKDFEQEADFVVVCRAGAPLDSSAEEAGPGADLPSDATREDALRTTSEMICREHFLGILRRGMPDWNGVSTRVIDRKELSPSLVVLTEEFTEPSGETYVQGLFVGKGRSGWRILMPHSIELERAWIAGSSRVEPG